MDLNLKKIDENILFKDLILNESKYRDQIDFSISNPTPLSIYYSLKKVFDEPDNGFMWSYHLIDKNKNAYKISESQNYHETNITIFPLKECQLEKGKLKSSLIKYLVYLSEKYKEKTDNLISTSQSNILVNPYYSYKTDLENILLEITSLVKFKHNTPKLLKAYNSTDNKHNYNQEIIHKTFMLEPSLIRTSYLINIFTLEAFVNLILELFIIKEYKKSIQGSVPMESKIRFMPFICSSFSKKYFTSSVINQIVKLYNKRNEFIHSNFKDNLKSKLVFFDEKSFKGKFKNNSTNEIFPSSMLKISKEHVYTAIEIRENLETYIQSEMKKEFQDFFERVKNKSLFSYTFKNGFPEEIDRTNWY